MCKMKKQVPIKRCKHFELGGDKKRKVKKPKEKKWTCCSFFSVLGTNDPILADSVFHLSESHIIQYNLREFFSFSLVRASSS